MSMNILQFKNFAPRLLETDYSNILWKLQDLAPFAEK